MFSYATPEEKKGKKCRCGQGTHLVRMCPSFKYVCLEFCLTPTKESIGNMPGPKSLQYTMLKNKVEWVD